MPPNVTFPAVYAFGDSILDTGNNNFIFSIMRANFPPYGRDFTGGVPTGRFCNGKVPSDMVVEAFGIKTYLPPYLDPYLTDYEMVTGVNFASSGAGYDSVTNQLVGALSLDRQLELFDEYKKKLRNIVGDDEAKRLITNGAYLLSVVSNDIANTYYHTPFRNLEFDVPRYADLLVASASFFLEKLHGLGARRLFIFNSPPLGCIPSQKTLGGGLERKCVDEYNEMAQLFNSKLTTEINKFNKEYFNESKIVIIDTYSVLLDIMENYERDGFKKNDKGCCGTGLIEVALVCNERNPFTCKDAEEYVFWDSFHPTQKAYGLIVNRSLQNLTNQFSCNVVTCL